MNLVFHDSSLPVQSTELSGMRGGHVGTGDEADRLHRIVGEGIGAF